MRTILYLRGALVLFCMGCVVVQAQPIVTESTSKSETTVKSPPPSAISPSITTINNKMFRVFSSLFQSTMQP